MAISVAWALPNPFRVRFHNANQVARAKYPPWFTGVTVTLTPEQKNPELLDRVAFHGATPLQLRSGTEAVPSTPPIAILVRHLTVTRLALAWIRLGTVLVVVLYGAAHPLEGDNPVLHTVNF